MYTGLFHSHKLIVLIFLVHYIAKLVLLLMNRHDSLSKYAKVTRIPEMILSAGFLISGASMLYLGAILSKFIVIKLVCIFSSIPLAVIGFKRSNKVLAFIAVFLIIASYGLAEVNKKAKTGVKIDTSSIKDPLVAGKLIYDNKCAQCHGERGNAGKSGSTDLTSSKLTTEQQKVVIRTEKNAMPAFKEDILSDTDLEELVKYITTLKK